jgi:hypothetical protein
MTSLQHGSGHVTYEYCPCELLNRTFYHCVEAICAGTSCETLPMNKPHAT